MKRIVIEFEVEFGRILSGAGLGRTCFRSLLDLLPSTPSEKATLVILDFSRVQVATASFLRESVFSLKAHLRAIESNFYPVIANASEVLCDELLLLSKVLGSPYLVGRWVDGDLEKIEVVGDLDPKQKMTFDAVVKLGRTDAADLMDRFGSTEGTTRTTAWNNRLSALAKKGLIITSTQGRAKSYRAIGLEAR